MAEFPRAAQGAHGFPQTSMFDQPELERLLRDALARRPECDLRTGVEVVGVDVGEDSDGPVRVTFRRDGAEEHLWADAVLGCDGAGSLARDAVGAGWQDLRFEERWTVVDVRTRASRSAAGRAWTRSVIPHRPATFMRVGEDRYRWEFRLRESRRSSTTSGCASWSPPGWISRTAPTSRWSGRLSTPSGPVSPTDGARGASSCSATPRTSPRRSSGRGCAPGLRDAHNLTWKLAASPPTGR